MKKTPERSHPDNLKEQSMYKILVVDDHEAVLEGTVRILQQQYPNAEIVTSQTLENARQKMDSFYPDLAIADLSIPEKSNDLAKTETGMQLLRMLMNDFPALNIVVQSAHVRSLIRLKPAIYAREGGFTIVDKSLPLKEMLKRVDLAIQGLTCLPKEMRRAGIEVRPEWLEVLTLAFQEGLQDKEIAKRMNIAERTVGHYWTKIKDVLDVYPEPGKNLRIQTEMRAREEGLID
jgi:DNA-binding NarL/FixJ family response regulator